MATAIADTGPPDLRAPGSYTIRLGSSLKASSTTRLTSVKYNHKPTISQADDSTISIVREDRSQALLLSLKDGDEEYVYKGDLGEENDTYILIPNDKDDGYTLEKISATHAFNLTSAPWESNANVLAKQYPQINILESEHSDEGIDASSEEPDPDNPYDFRHYMDSAETAAPSPNTARLQVASNRTPSVSKPPTAQAKSDTSKTRPARKPQPITLPPKQNPKLRTESKVSAPSSPAAPSQSHKDIPTVRLERRGTAPAVRPPKRKQSVQDINFDDESEEDDGLVVEDARPLNSKRSLGLALAGQLGEGPVSLRSAASSPGSRMASPAVHAQPTKDEDEEMGVDREEEDEDDADADADDQDMDDDDVDGLQLPSPAREPKPSVSESTIVNEDDDDDLANMMLMELEAGDDDGTGHAVAMTQEEEEESEEE